MAGAKVSGGPVAVVFVRTTGTVFPNGCVHSPPPRLLHGGSPEPPPPPPRMLPWPETEFPSSGPHLMPSDGQSH